MGMGGVQNERRNEGVKKMSGALSFLGPVMWGWLALDLAYKAIGTDYARVIRAVFILAQVRLVSTGGFIQAPHTQPSSQTTQQQPLQQHHQHAQPSSRAPQQYQQHSLIQYQQHQRQRRSSPTSADTSASSASNQEVVVEGDAAGHKGVMSAVVPYGDAAAAAAAAAMAVAAAEAAGGWQGGHCGEGEAAVQAVPAESYQAGVEEGTQACTAEEAAKVAAAPGAAAVAEAAGGWRGGHAAEGGAVSEAEVEEGAQACAADEEAARMAAALEVHPHRFRHLLDCSEELCDDEVLESWLSNGYGSDSEEDPFCDSVC
ncbi:hypothetical protein DUNSADRAFT_9804 [Dunaliella salina]|uniref:Uncharacterized protein n=1 Tax=Dunaliella salina TaxID=3046 RepID=A0ABQ7GGP1_DUNSA|nr:hypothetical protein DUNSADRAFT_9804 [Dunaliella salina]|eukprot:KAF5833780.1 hypothetical protein DUNSADRAFT_9804 [Dunaliella salina]